MADPKRSANNSDFSETAANDYSRYLPGVLGSTAGSVLPTEQSLLDANKVLTPQQNQLSLDTYKQFAPQFAAIGQQIGQQQQQGQAQTNLGLLQDYAPQIGAAAAAANNAADPLAAANRTRTDSGLSTLFGSLDDPNKISGSESANITRELDRQNISRGNTNPSATSTVQSAMQFGQAGDALKAQKQGAINQAVATATGAQPGLSNGVNATQLTLGAPVNNPGAQQYTGVTNAGGTEFNFGNSLMSNINQGLQSSLSADSTRRQFDQRANDAVGSVCCFIFMEAYHGLIPKCVRRSRDLHMTPANRAGYIWMSKWLVPVMEKIPAVRELIHDVMIKPLTEDAAWVCGSPGGVRRDWARKFWLGLWEILGKVTGVPISYKACRGKKWTFGKWQVELWHLPKNFHVPKHTHKLFASLFVSLRGMATIAMNGSRMKAVGACEIHKIPANSPHELWTGNEATFSFLNIQRWATKPTSASVDFNLL